MRLPTICFLALLVSVSSCKKESLPPGSGSAAVFSLAASGGICSNSALAGSYAVGTALNASNTVQLEINVASIGSYAVSSSVVSGIYFTDSGSFVHTGIQTIQLKGNGTPTVAGIYTFLFTAGSSSCRFNISISQPNLSDLADNDNLLFGNPSRAASLEDSAGNYLMRKTYYTLSYNRDRGTPNWVSWHLFSADLGTVSRQDDFRPDFTLPAGWYEVPESAYSGSGFDRGHNIPSGDRTSNTDANSATFLMTNMIPQAPVLNQNTWAVMEDSLRRLVSAGNELYIVMGSYGKGGTGSNGFTTTVDAGRVTVPSNIWKIALVIPNGNNDTSRVNAGSRLIAVNIPNNNSINGNWKNYRVTVDAIESATGYDLLNRLPVALQAILEAKTDGL